MFCRIRVIDLLPDKIIKTKDPQVVYDNCTKIPVAPKGTLWPEEQYIYDPELTSVLDLADVLKSRMWVDGSSDVKVGDTVHVKLLLYDGHGNRRKDGGDLVSSVLIIIMHYYTCFIISIMKNKLCFCNFVAF